MAVDGPLDPAVQADPLIRRRFERLMLAAAVAGSALHGPTMLARASIPQGFAAPRTPGRIPQGFTMSAGSMLPTLLVGDVISAVAYTGPPRRGDVIIFKVPGQKDVPWVKRLIGLPGETVQMKEGRLYIDGKIVNREPIAKVRAPDISGADAEVPTYEETLPGGVAHTIVEIQGDLGFNDNTEPFKVPPDSLFVMGDNRDNSTDSRVPVEQGGIGYIPLRGLIGRADIVIGSKTRNDRTMTPIH